MKTLEGGWGRLLILVLYSTREIQTTVFGQLGLAWVTDLQPDSVLGNFS